MLLQKIKNISHRYHKQVKLFHLPPQKFPQVKTCFVVNISKTAQGQWAHWQPQMAVSGICLNVDFWCSDIMSFLNCTTPHEGEGDQENLFSRKKHGTIHSSLLHCKFMI